MSVSHINIPSVNQNGNRVDSQATTPVVKFTIAELHKSGADKLYYISDELRVNHGIVQSLMWVEFDKCDQESTNGEINKNERIKGGCTQRLMWVEINNFNNKVYSQEEQKQVLNDFKTALKVSSSTEASSPASFSRGGSKKRKTRKVRRSRK